MNSIHPSLIFFERGMSESSIQKAVGKLHGKETKEENLHKFLLKLKETNELLVGGVPQIGLMFTQQKTYSYQKVPGFITVPVLFKADELYDYVNQHIPQCRVLANEYCERVKV